MKTLLTLLLVVFGMNIQAQFELTGRGQFDFDLHIMDSTQMGQTTVKGNFDIQNLSFMGEYYSVVEYVYTGFKDQDCNCGSDRKNLPYHRFGRLGLGYASKSLRLYGFAEMRSSIDSLYFDEDGSWTPVMKSPQWGLGLSLDHKSRFLWLEASASTPAENFGTIDNGFVRATVNLARIETQGDRWAFVIGPYASYLKTSLWGEQMSAGFNIGAYGYYSLLVRVGFTENRYDGMLKPLRGVMVGVMFDLDTKRNGFRK